MTPAEFIQSGIIETFCLGFSTAEENVLVQEMAEKHPEVKVEIDRVKNSFNHFLQERKMQPSSRVKTGVMSTIYSQQALIKPEWIPLMHQAIHFDRYYEAAVANNLQFPQVVFDNLFVKDLPSTKEIVNFAVWAKKGHEEEMHDDMEEFLALLEGSCDMYMDGEIISYSKGDIIHITKGVRHRAVVTSQQPMFALVQRQFF